MKIDRYFKNNHPQILNLNYLSLLICNSNNSNYYYIFFLSICIRFFRFYIIYAPNEWFIIFCYSLIPKI